MFQWLCVSLQRKSKYFFKKKSQEILKTLLRLKTRGDQGTECSNQRVKKEKIAEILDIPSCQEDAIECT